MKKWIHGSSSAGGFITYIVDSDLITQRTNALKLPIAGKDETFPRYHVWFPIRTRKGQLIIIITELPDKKTKLQIANWILELKRQNGEISPGDDILEV